MSVQSQQNNLNRLTTLLGTDLSFIDGDRESGPNGAKKVFLNTGRVFLRALSQDLRLRESKVICNPGGIAVSGECSLMGMWETGGLFVSLEQPCFLRENVLLYRTIRNLRDHKGGYNRTIHLSELKTMPYEKLVAQLSQLRSEDAYGYAA